MKNVVGLGVVALAAGLLLSACGTAGGMSNTADKPVANQSATTEATAPVAEAPPVANVPEPQPAVAKVGSTITLEESGEGSQVAVTVKKIVDPAKSSSEYSTPKAGSRLVAVQFQIQNTGTIPYRDSPSAKVTDADGQQFDSTFDDVTAGPGFAGRISLMPGKKALGYIVFEVPKASKLATVQFGLGFGFGAQGEWEAK